MTLTDIKNVLVSHFLTETVFSIKDDLAAIKLDSKVVSEAVIQHKETLFRAALEDFVKQDFVKQGVVIKVEEDLYLLTRHINSFIQNVPISPVTAEMIYDLISSVKNNKGENTYTVDKTCINDDDIKTICHICQFLANEQQEEEAS